MTTAASPPDGSTDPDAPNAVDHDDDALSWGDADDATHVDAAHNPVRVKDRTPHDPEAPTGSGALVGMGVLGGLYLLYTVAWLVSASLLTVTGTGLAGIASETMRVLAIMAPALWFAATLWLCQGHRDRTRFTWLVVGAVVLIPWPFIMTRSFG
ncbi:MULTISPECIES: hypothetical protein [unclassified Curtobacterium]|uniref:hypothetical protein n=1 Tax=unclassified Curtobacterium TaxID=257496 RepID=UPI0008DE3114|nr:MULTISPECIES: hypothetical protein [unclassified Curtobacterium]OIH92266.1 hypothetical protein BIU92_11300 [Curtobacterium sp. MCBA15_003]OII10379.1 hypothetical protein BIU97_09520 [Curtobacterium sp. MCBA15_009]OII30245.1 hypothetical protein BIU94_11775 [Curtobacterium sp. MMLR14_006]